MDENHLEFCSTEKQLTAVKLYIEGHSEHQVAKLMGVSRATAQSFKRAVRKKAAAKGYAPDSDMIRICPSNYNVKGTSTLYGDDGQVKVQWVKTDLEKEDQLEAVEIALKNFIKDHEKRSPFVPTPTKGKRSNELAVVNIGDAHFGMYAHKDISGENYDVNIAAQRHKDVFMRLMNNAPDCDTIVINQLGDYYHADNYESTTTKGTRVDTDGRLEHVFLIGLEVMSFITEEALKKFKKVIVRHVKGNHDSVLSMGIKAHQQAYWRNNKRVKIEMSPAPTWVFEWGKTAFLVSHGHAPKPNKLAEYFTAKYPEEWGRTTHRYCYHGHIHSKNTAMETYGGCITESFAGLPSADAWHNEQGYVSGQSMCLIVLDKEKGEVRRSTERL